MNKLKKALQAGALAVFAVLVIAAPTFAASACFGKGEYSGLKAGTSGGNAPSGFTIKCTSYVEKDKTIVVYGKTQADCMKASTLINNPSGCTGNDLNTMIQTIINAVIYVIGIVAVIMIILGGISYATSQGDAAKVKKGKDTILYGIIGLVIAVLAYAIVNFVLGALAG